MLQNKKIAEKRLSGSGRVAARGFGDDILLALHQLGVGGLHVHHQIAVHLAHADHRRRAEHIEHQLLRRACLHARRTGYHFRADHRRNRHISMFLHRIVGGAGERDRACAQTLRIT